MIGFTTSGSTRRTSSFLKKVSDPQNLYSGLDALAKEGVSALQSATPLDSGLTASSWTYEVKVEKDRASIYWLNTNTVNGVNIAVILQYGHGTGTGGYVAGYDYINPALRPVFDKLADQVWKKVTSA